MWNRFAPRIAGVGLIALVAAPGALGFEPVRRDEVEGLTGKKVYIESQCEVRWSRPYASRPFFVGEEVTLAGRGERQIDAWCIVKDVEGKSWEIMVKHLSKTPPAYSMTKTGPLESFLGDVFEEAYSIPWKMTELWRANGYDMKEDEVTHAYDAYETAYSCHRALLFKLVQGRESKSRVLRDERFAWLWTADASVLDAYCEGMRYIEAYKGSELFKKAERAVSLVGSASNVTSFAGEISRLKHELRTKPWLSSIKKDAPESLRQALDREETQKREARIAELERRIAKAFSERESDAKELGL